MSINNITHANPNDLKCAAPFNELFPVDQKMVETIAANMLEQGFDPAFPIIINEDGVVLDGHTRLAAAKEAGIDVCVIKHLFPDEDAALKFAFACQLHRRNLTEADVARYVQVLDKRMTPKDAGTKGAQGCAGSGPSSAATAKRIGVSRRKVEQVRTVLDHAEPDLKEAVLAGKQTINGAYSAVVSRKASAKPAAAGPRQPRQWVCALSAVVNAGTEAEARHAASVMIRGMSETKLVDRLTCKRKRENMVSSLDKCRELPPQNRSQKVPPPPAAPPPPPATIPAPPAVCGLPPPPPRGLPPPPPMATAKPAQPMAAKPAAAPRAKGSDDNFQFIT